LIHQGDGVGAAALQSLGITLDAVRQKVEETIGTAGTAPSASPPFTPRAKVIQLMSGHSQEEHSGVWEPIVSRFEGNPSTSPEPRCPQCRVGLPEVARFRTIDVPPDHTDNDIEAISIDVVYCARCGMTLQILRSDPPTSNAL
jgi:hypothetical protein